MSVLLEEREVASAESFIQHAVSFGDSTAELMCQKCGQQCRDEAVQIQRHGFRIGLFGFLFPESCMGEIVTDPQICPVPHTRNWMLGVMMLRGNLIPVFDLHNLLFETPVDLHKPMVLILDQGKQALGFVLKEPPQWLTELVEAPTTEVLMPDLLATLIGDVYRQQETSWLTFNKTELFSFLAENAKSC